MEQLNQIVNRESKSTGFRFRLSHPYLYAASALLVGIGASLFGSSCDNTPVPPPSQNTCLNSRGEDIELSDNMYANDEGNCQCSSGYEMNSNDACSLKQTEPADVCGNIAGLQESTPDNMTNLDGICTCNSGFDTSGDSCVPQPIYDACRNIAGIQSNIPTDYSRTPEGDCLPKKVENLVAKTKPTQVGPGGEVTLDGTAVNATSYSHFDENGNFLGSNGKTVKLPYLGRNKLRLHAENSVASADLEYVIVVRANFMTSEEEAILSGFSNPASSFCDFGRVQDNYWNSKLSPSAQSEVNSLIQALNTPYQTATSLAANDSGLYIMFRIVDANIVRNYQEGIYFGLIPPGSSISPSSISEVKKIATDMGSVPSSDDARSLIKDYLTFNVPTASFNQNEQICLPNGDCIHVNVSARYTIAGMPYIANFTWNPVPEDRSRIIAYTDWCKVNGDVGITATIIEPTINKWDITRQVHQIIERE